MQSNRQHNIAYRIRKCWHSVVLLARKVYDASMQEFSVWLPERLRQLGLSNSDLERASGVSNSIIWRWQNGTPRRPSPANLEKIAPALGVPYEDLMKMCGYLSGKPVAAPVSPIRQVAHAQLDHWLNAVGEDYEAYFTDSLKAHGDSARDLIELARAARTAVSTTSSGAVSHGVSGQAKKSKMPKKGGKGPLMLGQHLAGSLFTAGDRRRSRIAA